MSGHEPSLAPIRKRRLSLGVLLLRLFFKVAGTVSPGAAARVAHFIWFRPSFSRRSSSPSEVPAVPTQPISARVGSKTLRASVSVGDGPPVLLVHGFGGSRSQFQHFVPALVDSGYRVLVCDFPAHGESDGDFTDLPEMADALLVVTQDFQPLHGVIAHSFGATCATYAFNKGLCCRKAVYISPPNKFRSMVRSMSELLAYSDAVETGLCRLLERDFGADVWERFSTDYKSESSTTPLLVIHDRDDKEISWRDGEALANTWANAKLLLTNDLGHTRILRSDLVIHHAIDFLKGPE